MSAARPRCRIALVGMPNTGKSTLFNRLTGVQAKVANWPGMTVDLLTAKVILGGRTVELVDLPGLYSLHGFSEDERLVRHFLEQEDITALVAVVNAVQLERQLPLVLQLQALGRPLAVVLNMADEARRLGIRIDAARLAEQLAAQVLLVDSKHGLGITAVLGHADIGAGHPGSHPRKFQGGLFHHADHVHESRLLPSIISAGRYGFWLCTEWMAY